MAGSPARTETAVHGKRRRITVLALLVFALLSLQLFRPDAPRAVLPGDGSISDHVAVPGDVEVLLRTACYDCHSGETRWPWYSRVSPVSWIIASDVQHGRSNLDFSRWSIDPDREPTPVQRLKWMCRDIREKIMPPRLYRLAHAGARLSKPSRPKYWRYSICAAT
jgi:hypothetical protein